MILRFLFLALLILPAVFCGCRRGQTDAAAASSPGGSAPASLLAEHRMLLAWMDSVLPASDSACNQLRTLLNHHFAEEEKLVFPLLGALPSVVEGRLPEDASGLAAKAGDLAGQLGHFSAEHQMAGVLLSEIFSSHAADTVRMGAFREALLRHAHLEDEVLFPAAILAGQQISSQLQIHE